MTPVNPEAQFLIDFVSQWRPSKTLEVGCNSGSELMLIVEPFTDVYGIDKDIKLISEAQRLIPSGYFEVGDAEELPYEDDTFDLVYSSGGILTHNSPDLVGAILDEMFRVAKGKILLIEYGGTRTSPDTYTNCKKNTWIHDLDLLMVGRSYTPIVSKIVPLGLDKFWVFACDKGVVNIQARAIDIEAKIDRNKGEFLTQLESLRTDVDKLVRIATTPRLGRWARLKRWLGI